MKKLLCLFSVLMLLTPQIEAKKPVIDPLYLNSDVIDMDELQETEQPKEEKKSKKKKKSKHKKIRKYDQIDKSKTPITMEDYYTLSAEKLRTDFEIPKPQFNQDTDFIFPEPQFRVISYNLHAGERNIDLTKVVSKGVVTSPAILSPDKTKMVYTKSFYYPQTAQVTSSVYLIPIEGGFKDAYDILYNTNVVQGSTKSIFSVGMDNLEKYKFTTLFPVDFSKDSKKLAFKEKIGSNFAGTWITNIIIYDFENQSYKRLNAIREAIIYYFRQNKKIELKDYMWDIYPIGWDKNNADRIVVYAYAYTENNPLFLGTWSIDAEENRAELISPSSTEANIDLNGFGLLEYK